MNPDQLHRLVLLYLSVAYETDHHFDPLERQTAIQLASRWAPDFDSGQVEDVVDTAFAISRARHSDEVEALAREVGAALTPDRRLRVLADLGRIARADGYLSMNEASVISRIRTIWGAL